MQYCFKCGHKLIRKELENEGMIPYCTNCNEYRFPLFNSAISTVIFNKTKDKVLLIQQYGRKANILVAGYINKGENAKETLIREVKEEVGLKVVNYIYNDNVYFEKTNTLIHNYMSFVESEEFTLTKEVDFAKWYTIEEAIVNIKENSLAKQFFFLTLHKMGHSKKLCHYEEERIYIKDGYDKVVAEINFPYEEDCHKITHTFVDPSLRGLKIASILVEEAINHIHSKNKKIIPVCSYAVKYFDKNKVLY